MNTIYGVGTQINLWQCSLATRSTMYIVHSTYICVSLVRSSEMCKVCVLANLGEKEETEKHRKRDHSRAGRSWDGAHS